MGLVYSNTVGALLASALTGRARIGPADPKSGLALVQQALALNPDQEDLRELRQALTAPKISGR